MDRQLSFRKTPAKQRVQSTKAAPNIIHQIILRKESDRSEIGRWFAISGFYTVNDRNNEPCESYINETQYT